MFTQTSWINNFSKKSTADECAPGDEKCCVVVRRMVVVLDILALLPDTEVVERGGSVEAHSGPLLFQLKRD